MKRYFLAVALCLVVQACAGDEDVLEPDASTLEQCPVCESDQICVQFVDPDCSGSARCVEKPTSCEPDVGGGVGCSDECTSLCSAPYDCQNPPTVACGSEDPGAVVCNGP